MGRGDFTGVFPSRDSVAADRSNNFTGISDEDIDADSGYMPARWAVRVVPDMFSSVPMEARSCSAAFSLYTAY